MLQNSPQNFALLTWTVRRTNTLTSAWNSLPLLKIQTRVSLYVVYQQSRHSRSWQDSFHSSFSPSGESGVQARWTQSSLPILFMDTIMRSSDSHRFMKTSFRMEQSVSSSSVSLLFHVACITYVFSVSFPTAYLTYFALILTNA